jgi:hypothetical protein
MGQRTVLNYPPVERLHTKWSLCGASGAGSVSVLTAGICAQDIRGNSGTNISTAGREETEFLTVFYFPFRERIPN